MATVVEARDLRVYINGRLVSGPATLRAGRGEIVMIVGPNGAGKTSLLKALAGLNGRVDGRLRVEGRTAYVPQNDLLLPWKTIRENIELAIPDPGEKGDVEHLYDALGLREYLDKYPRHASGGTRRKAAIARGLVMGANILLLDEPFTGVDAASLKAVLDIIERLAREGLTIIIVTHQIYLVSSVASKAILLEPPPRGTTRSWTLEGLSKLERYRVAEDIVSYLARLPSQKAS